MTELRSHGYGYVPHPVKPSHVARLDHGSLEWWAANNNAAVRAMAVEGVYYGGRQYAAPKWKTADDHSWINELLAEHEAQEAAISANLDTPDLCIRGPVRVKTSHKFIAQTIRAQEREAAKALEASNPCTDNEVKIIAFPGKTEA